METRRSNTECMAPFIVKNKVIKNPNNYEYSTPVPCGKCPACYKRRASQWSFRLMQEDKVATSAYFLTLTYDTENVYITPRGYMGLAPRGQKGIGRKGQPTYLRTDIQLFFRRLRKNQNGNAKSGIKYFAVGEYGGKFKRPHYHVILYNAELKLMVSATDYKVLMATGLDGKTHVRSPFWPYGTITVGKVEGASIGYCLVYISKPSKIPQHANDDRSPEFAYISKGLGKSYLTPAVRSWHKKKAAQGDGMYVNLVDGRKVGMSRYYKEKIYEPEVQRSLGVISRYRMLEQKSTDGKQMSDSEYNAMRLHQFTKPNKKS